MLWLIRFCIKNPILVVAFALLVAVAGGRALFSTPVDAIPDITDNQVIVLAEWHGRSPQDVDDQITSKLEAALQGTPGVTVVRGMSEPGMSMIYVVFEEGVALREARTRVSERLQSARSSLPDGVSTTMGPDATPLGQIFWYTLEGAGHDAGALRSLQDGVVRPALRAVPGVSEVASIGGFVREYHVEVDPVRLGLFGLTVNDLRRAVSRTDVDVGVGADALLRGGMAVTIRGVGSLEGREDIEAVVVGMRGDNPLLLRDVAEVRPGPQARVGALADERGERVGGVVTMRRGENPRAVIERVKQALARVEPALPAGVSVVPFYDRTRLVDETMGTLREAVVQEILVTVGVIVLFLLNFRISLIVAISLPLGVLMAFIAMRLLGIGSDLMSLCGIAIAIGTMDDMGIVMSENIFAHLQNPDDPRPRIDRIVAAAREVAPAITTAVAAMIVSFLPVFFLTGQAGKLFTPLAWTKTFCVVSSLIVAIVLVPVLCHLFLDDSRNATRSREVRALAVALASAGGFFVGWRLPALELLPPLRPLWPALAVAMVFAAISYRTTVERFVPIDQNPVSRLIYRGYEPSLRWVLANKRRFLAMAGAVVALGLLVFGGLRLYLAPLHVVVSAFGGTLSRIEPFHTLEQKAPPIGEAFMPPLDEGSLLYMPSLLPQASLEESVDVMIRLNRRIREVPEVAQVMGKAGRADTALDPAPAGMLEIVVNLKPRAAWRPGVSRQSLLDELRQKTEMIGVTPSWLQPIEARVVMLQSDLRASLALRIVGAPLSPDGAPAGGAQARLAIDRLAAELSRAVAGVPGAEDVHPLRASGKPYLEIVVDPDRAARFGANPKDIMAAVHGMLGGERLTSTMEGRERLAVRIQVPRELRDDPEALGRLLIPTGTVSGAAEVMSMGHGGAPPVDGVEPGARIQVPLRWLATLREVLGPALIRTENGQLTGYVMFNAGEGGEERVMADALAVAERLRVAGAGDPSRSAFPPGLRVEPAGRYLDKIEADRRLLLIVPAVVAVNLLLLYLAFRRLGLTLAIMAAIPIAFAGGFIALRVYPLLTGGEPIHLTTAVWVGFIALFGISVDDGAVMGSYLVQRFEGRRFGSVEEIRQAVVDAGLRRIRPCLMTTATTIVSLVPVLWSSGRGSDVMQPMAVPLLGGLVVSLVTLFTVPALFSWVEERRLLAGEARSG